MCRIELPSVSCGVPGLCHAAIGSASSSHGLGIVEGGSLAGNESASVLSILRSRRQGLGFRRMACRRLVSASSGEVITTKTSLHRLSGFRIGDREKLKPATLVRVHCHAIASFSWNRNPSPAVCATYVQPCCAQTMVVEPQERRRHLRLLIGVMDGLRFERAKPIGRDRRITIAVASPKPQ